MTDKKPIANRRALGLNATHGCSRVGKMTKEYITWTSLRTRCHNPKNPGFCNYGGRGIKVCERWDIFSNFLADMGIRPEGATIERINNNGNYEPSNCRWATRAEQSRNRRKPCKMKLDHRKKFTFNGKTQHLAAWAREYNLNAATINSRMERGWSFKDALLKPKPAHPYYWQDRKALNQSKKQELEGVK